MRPRALLFLIFLAIFPLLLSSVATPFPETIRSISNQTFKPVFQASHFFTDRAIDWIGSAQSFMTVYKQNKNLQKEIYQLQSEIFQLREQNGKYERLEKLIPFVENKPDKVILSHIIFRDISLWNQGIVIDKGSSQGVKKQMAVISDQGLVGRVVSVSQDTAQVILLTDIHSRVSVLSQESRDTGLIYGTRSSTLMMKFISLDSTIKIGDTIVSSGIGGIYPKGIPVGKVDSVGKESDGLHLFAVVKPFTEFSNIEEVLCLAQTLKDLELFSSL